MGLIENIDSKVNSLQMQLADLSRKVDNSAAQSAANGSGISALALRLNAIEDKLGPGGLPVSGDGLEVPSAHHSTDWGPFPAVLPMPAGDHRPFIMPGSEPNTEQAMFVLHVQEEGLHAALLGAGEAGPRILAYCRRPELQQRPALETVIDAFGQVDGTAFPSLWRQGRVAEPGLEDTRKLGARMAAGAEINPETGKPYPYLWPTWGPLPEDGRAQGIWPASVHSLTTAEMLAREGL